MKKWAVLVLLGAFPCVATAGTTIEEMNRAVGSGGLASQLDDSDLEKIRAYGASDFDGRNQKVVTSDERLKKQLSTDLTMTDQNGKAVRVQVTGVAPAVSEAEDVSDGATGGRVTNVPNAPAAQGNTVQQGLLQNVAGKVVRGAQPAQPARGNQPAQTVQTQDFQNTPTAPVSGKQGGGVYFPGRPGQGGLGSKVPPLPSSGTTLQPSKQTVQPAEKKAAKPEEQKVQPDEKKAVKPEEQKVQPAEKKSVPGRAPEAQTQEGRGVHQPQPARDLQNTPPSGRQGIYYPGRPGQGSLDSYVPPVPASGEQPAQAPSARPSGRQVTQVTTTHETATLSGPQGEGAAEAQRIMAATQGDTTSVIQVPQAVSKMSEEDRHKYYTCLRLQSRARRARAAGITMGIGACENMELDKIKLVREGEMSQEEFEARADELAAQSLRNAKQQAQSSAGAAAQRPAGRSVAKQQKGNSPAPQTQVTKAQQSQKESLQKKSAKAKQKQLKTANKECSAYTYDDICTECCDSYGGFSGNLEGGHCVCR